MTITYEAILGAVARGWCSKRNEAKVMDEELAEDIAIEIYTLSENHMNGELEEPIEAEAIR